MSSSNRDGGSTPSFVHPIVTVLLGTSFSLFTEDAGLQVLKPSSQLELGSFTFHQHPDADGAIRSAISYKGGGRKSIIAYSRKINQWDCEVMYRNRRVGRYSCKCTVLIQEQKTLCFK